MPAYLQVTYADGTEAEFELKHGSNVIGKVGERPSSTDAAVKLAVTPKPQTLNPKPRTLNPKP